MHPSYLSHMSQKRIDTKAQPKVSELKRLHSNRHKTSRQSHKGNESEKRKGSIRADSNNKLETSAKSSTLHPTT